LNLSFEARIPLESPTLCGSVLKSLTPDNLSAPPQIRIFMECSENSLHIIVSSSAQNVLTFRNTVDDIFEHIAIALRSLKVLKSLKVERAEDESEKELR